MAEYTRDNKRARGSREGSPKKKFSLGREKSIEKTIEAIFISKVKDVGSEDEENHKGNL